MSWRLEAEGEGGQQTLLLSQVLQILPSGSKFKDMMTARESSQ